MNIGKMNRNVTIQQPVYTISADNNDKYVSSWTVFKTLWASWVHQMSQEVFESGQMVAKDVYDWKCRYMDAEGVKLDMRILYNGDYYYIVSVKEIGVKEALQISTVKRDNGT